MCVCVCAHWSVERRDAMAAWSSGMILASGARGPGLNSRSSPHGGGGGGGGGDGGDGSGDGRPISFPIFEREHSHTMTDNRRQSQTVTDNHRQSQAITDNRRQSQTIADTRRQSQTVAEAQSRERERG